jgi:hypothetical protein
MSASRRLAAVLAVLALQPRLTIAAWKASWATKAMLSSELLALYTDGLRKAGVPEE